MSGAAMVTTTMAAITTRPAIAPRSRRKRRQIAGHGPASSVHPSIATSPDPRMARTGDVPGGGATVGAFMPVSSSWADRSRRAAEPRIGDRVEHIGDEAAAGDEHAAEHRAGDDDGVVPCGDRVDRQRPDPRPGEHLLD